MKTSNPLVKTTLACPLFVRASLFALLLGTLLNSTAMARPLEFKTSALGKAEMARVEKITREMDRDIKAALKRNPKLQKAMQAELKSVTAASAAASFQRKYGKQYAALLKAAGVDLNAYARQLSGALPGLTFKVSNNALVAKSIRRGKSKSPKTPSAKPKVVNIKDFRDEKELGCGGIAGSDVTFTQKTITNSTGAVGGGTCANEGRKYALLGNSVQSAQSGLTLRGNIASNVFAVGTIGTSAAVSSSSLGDDQAYAGCIAPVLWVCSEEAAITNVVKTLPLADLQNVDRVETGSTRTSLITAFAPGSFAQATLKNLSVIVE